jgi:tryptophanyl-tRNA synthetase
MSLVEPTKKMSKSDPKPKSRILITDSKEEIYARLRNALTDSIKGVSYDRGGRPGVSNLIDLMYHFDESAAVSPEELASDMKNLSMQSFKYKVADTIDRGISDTRERYEELMGGDQKRLVEHAEEGARRAEAMAEETMKRVRSAMGMGW